MANFRLMAFVPADKETSDAYCSLYKDSDSYAEPNLTGLSALLQDTSDDSHIIISYNYLCPFNIYATYIKGPSSCGLIKNYGTSLGSKPTEIFNGGELVVSGDYIYKNKCINGNIEFVRDLSQGSAITSIEESMFSGCGNMTSIRLPWVNSLTIGDTAFLNCSSLQYFFCYNRVTSVGDNAFRNCSSLKGNEIACGNYITRNKGISNLQDCLKVCFDCGNYSFAYCTSLTKIAFHDGSFSIVDQGFPDNNTGNLMLISKGNRYVIGSHAFEGCTGLTGICEYYIWNEPEYNTNYTNGIYISTLNININNADYCFADCTSLDGTLTFYFYYADDKIPEGMFYGCSLIKHLGNDNTWNKMSSSADIGDDAFLGTRIPYDDNGDLRPSSEVIAELLTIVDEMYTIDTTEIAELNRIFGPLW